MSQHDGTDQSLGETGTPDQTIEKPPTSGSGNSWPDIAANIDAFAQECGDSDGKLVDFRETLQQNLGATERLINSGYYRIVLVFVGFVAIDSGLVARISVAGAELEAPGPLLLLFPLAMALLAHQMFGRIVFATDLKAAIAFIYRKTAPTVYRRGLDFLTYPPSVRNVETYHTLLLQGRGRSLANLATIVVALSLGVAPILAIAYCLVRTFSSPAVPLWSWLTSVLIATSLLLHMSLRASCIPLNRDPDLFTRKKTW